MKQWLAWLILHLTFLCFTAQNLLSFEDCLKFEVSYGAWLKEARRSPPQITVTFPFLSGLPLGSGRAGTSPELIALFQHLNRVAPEIRLDLIRYTHDGFRVGDNERVLFDQTIEGDLRENPALLNFAGCYSSGCVTLQRLVDAGHAVIRPVLVEPYQPQGAVPFIMRLTDAQSVTLINSGSGGILPWDNDANYRPVTPAPVVEFRASSSHGGLLSDAAVLRLITAQIKEQGDALLQQLLNKKIEITLQCALESAPLSRTDSAGFSAYSNGRYEGYGRKR